MRHRRRRMRTGSGRRRLFAVLLALLVAAAALLLHCRAAVLTFAESQALWIAERQVNAAFSRVLTEQAELCRSLIHVTYGENQTVAAVVADTAAVNTIRTDVGSYIMEAMEGMATVSADVPLGTLCGPEALSGWGPVWRFPMSVTATVLSSSSSSLESTGINQSMYRVLVNLQVSLCVVTSAGRSTVSLDSSFPVAESVLLGKVPDTLTQVYDDDDDIPGKIFNYGQVD